ncbi:MAG: dTMP kinase [Hyphomicrobiaceae bacterium]|nr:dTMP kinase [Hyphomicrobiaceae bacterium]
MAAGLFITFEGGEGAGKSTQVRLLAERLRAHGTDVVITREPGGTPFAEQVRALILSPSVAEHTALSEALLFYAARADHIGKIIRPAMAAGRAVLCDRFSDSTRVYQSIAGGLDRKVFDALEQLVVADAKPELTIILDLDPSVGLARAEARRIDAASGEGNGERNVDSDGAGRDRYERQALAFHEKLRAGFLAIAAEEPDRCVVINANRDASQVAAEVWSVVDQHLQRRAG